MTKSNNSSVTASTGANLPTPALMKSTSMLPNFCFTPANSVSISVKLAASERTARTSPPIFRFASSSVAWSRPVMTIRAPCSLNSFAVARPMPELPPVMTATLPSNLPIAVSPFLTCLVCLRPQRLCDRHLPGLQCSGTFIPEQHKNLVQHRERDLHNVFQRLPILGGL